MYKGSLAPIARLGRDAELDSKKSFFKKKHGGFEGKDLLDWLCPEKVKSGQARHARHYIDALVIAQRLLEAGDIVEDKGSRDDAFVFRAKKIYYWTEEDPDAPSREDTYTPHAHDRLHFRGGAAMGPAAGAAGAEAGEASAAPDATVDPIVLRQINSRLQRLEQHAEGYNLFDLIVKFMLRQDLLNGEGPVQEVTFWDVFSRVILMFVTVYLLIQGSQGVSAVVAFFIGFTSLSSALGAAIVTAMAAGAISYRFMTAGLAPGASLDLGNPSVDGGADSAYDSHHETHAMSHSQGSTLEPPLSSLPSTVRRITSATQPTQPASPSFGNPKNGGEGYGSAGLPGGRSGAAPSPSVKRIPYSETSWASTAGDGAYTPVSDGAMRVNGPRSRSGSARRDLSTDLRDA